MVINQNGAYVPNVSGYTDANGRWIRTSPATLYAWWTSNTYTVTLNPNGGSGGSSSFTATYGSSASGIVAPTRTGHDFNGYRTESAGGLRVIGENGQYLTNIEGYTNENRQWIRESGADLYAWWIPHTYNVRYDANGGMSTLSIQIKTYNVPLTLLSETPTRSGYTSKSACYRLTN
jgi:hypothetical protein